MRVAERTDYEVAVGIELEADAQGDVDPFVDQINPPVRRTKPKVSLVDIFP
jgi:hypothetical protein